jgi:hypothetical protein
MIKILMIFTNVNHYIDSFDIIPNAFTILGCHEDQIFPFKNNIELNMRSLKAMSISTSTFSWNNNIKRYSLMIFMTLLSITWNL